MHYELLTAFAAISRLSAEWQPDRRRTATVVPRPRQSGHRLFPVLRAGAARLLPKGPER